MSANPSSFDPGRSRSLRLAAYVWEVCGIWYIVLWLSGLVAIAAFGWSCQEEIDVQHRERLLLFLSEIRDKAETDLQLGFDIGEDRGIRQMLDNLIRKDATVRAIEIFDADWISRHSTDRGTTGEPVSEEWQRAAKRSSAHYWISTSETDATLGVPLRGAFREPVGHLAVTYQNTVGYSLVDSFKARAAIVLIVFLACLLAAPFFVLRGYVREVDLKERALFASDESAFDAAGVVLRLRRRVDDTMRRVGRAAR